jgi:dihydrofolate synthase/folylpolyglutamate synthase
MSYGAAKSYLLGTINETASRRLPNRLDRMRLLLHELGDPQERYPTIHVGGTSGKGSTSTMIAGALGANGRRIGLHTKPHLTSMTERSRVNGIAISEDDFADVLSEMMPAIERTTHEEGRPTYYETLLALAFYYFAQCSVDAAVIEVGLGGTLDGTNVLVPQVSVITNSGIDHTDVLGETIGEIAADEAGIAKPGVPLVTAATVPEARETIARVCRERGAPLVHVDDVATVTRRPSEPYGQSFDVRTASGTYELALPVLGSFQLRNAATAIVALEQLPEAMRPSRDDVERAFSQLMIPGRMEFFPAHPSVVFDVAHNADKAAALASALTETFEGRRLRFVIAIGESKDPIDVLAPLLALPASFTFTSFETPGRVSIRPQRLANIAQTRGVSGRAIEDPVEALTVARRDAAAADVIVVTGSTFVVATLREWWLTNVVARSTY